MATKIIYKVYNGGTEYDQINVLGDSTLATGVLKSLEDFVGAWVILTYYDTLTVRVEVSEGVGSQVHITAVGWIDDSESETTYIDSYSDLGPEPEYYDWEFGTRSGYNVSNYSIRFTFSCPGYDDYEILVDSMDY